MTGGVWFTSDLHFGHRRVSEIRGFTTAEEHDEAISANWRKSVRPDDHVWVLGDLAVSNPAAALARIANLPGVKHLIAGNHDTCHPMHRDSHKRQAAYLAAFASVQTLARRRVAGVEVFLSHFPYTADREHTRYPQYRLADCGAWLLHGHTHSGEWRTSPREIHVGLDAWGLAPVPLHALEALVTP